MLLLLLAIHPVCAGDANTLQMLLLPIDKESDGFRSGKCGGHMSLK